MNFTAAPTGYRLHSPCNPSAFLCSLNIVVPPAHVRMNTTKQRQPEQLYNVIVLWSTLLILCQTSQFDTLNYGKVIIVCLLGMYYDLSPCAGDAIHPVLWEVRSG